jgi:hypothetical protein
MEKSKITFQQKQTNVYVKADHALDIWDIVASPNIKYQNGRKRQNRYH